MTNGNRLPSFKSLLTHFAVPSDMALRVVIASLLVVVLASLFPRGEEIDVDYKVGAVWSQKDLIAPFSFALLREESAYNKDVDSARHSVYPVFEKDLNIEKQVPDKLKGFFGRFDTAYAAWVVLKRSQRTHHLSLFQDSVAFAQSRRRIEIPLNDGEWEALARLTAAGGVNRLETALAGALEAFHSVGVLDRPKKTLPRPDIALRKGTQEDILSITRLYDPADVQALLDQWVEALYKNDVRLRSAAYKIAITLFEPNIRFNQPATKQSLDAAIDAVSRTSGFVQENERIVSKHERITPETKLKLESLARARAERGSRKDYTLQRLGIALHVVIIVMLYGIYLYLFRKQIFRNNRRLALIALLIVLEGLFAYVTRELDVSAPIEFLILVPVASMLLTIIFDSRVAFYGTITIALLVAAIRGNDYAIALAAIIGGALSAYTVRDMRNRAQIFRSVGFIFLGYALTIIALGVERFESLNVVTEQLLYALANAVISPVLAYGLLIFFERVFRVTTDLTLMELSHFNHPLLRRLGEQAPGTYHHSLTIATLAEAAASSVGANEVLARIGALFHDIGKLEKPLYFVENQKGSRNKHDKLSPRMSSLIIAAHVKDGMTLCEEYGLPQEVIDFIPMHHGTTRIEYFYNKARELAQQSGDQIRIEEINEQDYRYPGPKPQTRETGILMLADAVEATTRTLDDPSPQRLEVVIGEIIKKRFDEGELDECPLTLKDLTKIKSAFLSALIGIYHSRVKYPEPPKKRIPKPRRSGQAGGAATQEPPLSPAPPQTQPTQ